MKLSEHGVVALVQDEAGKFLLLEDSREPMKGKWAPPHGRCEESDGSEEQGLIREVEEETGIKVEPVRKVFTQPADTKVKTVSFWLVKPVSIIEKVRLDGESSDYGWFSIDDALKKPLYPGTKDFFERVKNDDSISLL